MEAGEDRGSSLWLVLMAFGLGAWVGAHWPAILEKMQRSVEGGDLAEILRNRGEVVVTKVAPPG